MWKRLKDLDKYSLNCLPVDDCREFELDPTFEEKAIALSLNFFDWQKLERETSNPTIGKALRDTIIELNLALTCENWQQIANSTSIPNLRVALEESGFKRHQDSWIAIDSSCIDAVAYLEPETSLKIRFLMKLFMGETKARFEQEYSYSKAAAPRPHFIALIRAVSINTTIYPIMSFYPS
jgi:hypothetical protein